MLKKAFWIVLIASLIYGGYYYYSKEKPASAEKIKEDIFGFLSKTADNIAGTVKERAEEKKQEIFDSAEQSAKDYLQEKAAEAVSGLGGKLQSLAGDISSDKTVSSTSSQPENPPATIVIKKGDLFSVSVRGSSYSVDWGDGSKENNISINVQKLISHSWSAAGDYFVRIEVKDNGEVYTNSFFVRIN